mmetsp:Transcript_60342/g.108486  ORF Transcript_60342/g.108486 Transcript_60342/m.108486 type:complete len:82 (+) Transcript_60342:163-408(+)
MGRAADKTAGEKDLYHPTKFLPPSSAEKNRRNGECRRKKVQRLQLTQATRLCAWSFKKNKPTMHARASDEQTLPNKHPRAC